MFVTAVVYSQGFPELLYPTLRTTKDEAIKAAVKIANKLFGDPESANAIALSLKERNRYEGFGTNDTNSGNYVIVISEVKNSVL